MSARSIEIQSLLLQNFRCFENARFDCSADEIWLVGPNASGKTSLLEAIYVLMRGHTFLSARHGPLVRTGADSASIVCTIRSSTRNPTKVSCLIKGRSCHARINDTEISHQSLVQQSGLVRIFGANAQELVSGEPRIRRNFVDWNLFHVEPSYRNLLARYTRLLQQRNAALKSRTLPISIWDTDLSALSELIGAHREKYLTLLAHEIEVIGSRILENRTPILCWTHGWPPDLGMEAALQKNIDIDLRRGFTHYGAHRFTATLTFASTQTPGSRGEQKILAAILQMACEALQFKIVGKSSIWLIDDVFSELTQENSLLLINELRSFSGQIFFAGLTEPTKSLVKESSDHLVFNVDHGVFNNSSYCLTF